MPRSVSREPLCHGCIHRSTGVHFCKKTKAKSNLHVRTLNQYVHLVIAGKKENKFYKGSDFGAIQIQADESFVKTGDMSEQQTSMCQNVHLESHAFLFVHAVHMSKPRIHGRDVHR